MKNRTLFVILSIVSTMLLSVNSLQAAELLASEAQPKIAGLMALSEKDPAPLEELNQWVDLAGRCEKLIKRLEITSEAEKERMQRVVKSYLANSLFKVVRMPRQSRNDGLSTVWVRSYLGDQKAEELKNSAVTFAILDIKNSTDSARVTVQFVPELTEKTDISAQATFIFAKTDDEYRIMDIEFSGIQVLSIFAEQLKDLGRIPQTIIDTLLSKKMVTKEQIRDQIEGTL